MITNSVITMPLPERISGLWKRQATHHRIEKFELSPEEMQIEVDRQAQLLDKLSTEDKPQDEVTKKRGGFTKFTFDARQMAADAYGARSMFDNPMAAMMAQATFPVCLSSMTS